ncbi:MAG: hypothetical protein LBF12_05920 [Christensenellaceae bacterium]|jgi:hypothetical protein|nr:hypothetical protein [Christensenellaceae bacterium]
MKQKLTITIALTIIILSLLASIMLSCNNDNNDNNESDEDTIIPPTENPLEFIPISSAATGQFLLSPFIPRRGLILPIPVESSPGQAELACSVKNVTSDTNRLSYKAQYSDCSRGFYDPISSENPDFYVVHIYFDIALLGDEEFDIFKITTIDLLLNYQEISLPVNITIYDRRDYGIIDPNWTPPKTTYGYQFDKYFKRQYSKPFISLESNQKLISLENPDGTPLENIKMLVHTLSNNYLQNLNINGENSLNINFQPTESVYLYLYWDVDCYSGYISHELIVRYIIDDNEYFISYFVNLFNTNFMSNVFI